MSMRTLAVTVVLLLGCVGTVTAVGCVKNTTPLSSIPFPPREASFRATEGHPSRAKNPNDPFASRTHTPPRVDLAPDTRTYSSLNSPPHTRARIRPKHTHTRRELKAVDYGEVVAAEHYKVEGGVAMGMMPSVRTSDVKITLVINGGQKISTRAKPDGTFALLDVPPGVHLLDTFALGYTFPPLRVRIAATDGSISAEYAEDSAEKLNANPLVLKPVSTADYYEPRAGLSVGTLMRNPMFLLVAMTVLMAWLAPKMIEGMDPEALHQYCPKGF